MATAEEVSHRVNLQVLQRKDPQIDAILDSATQVALYNWNTELNKWEKPDVEGTLFVYSRSSGEPKYGFTIMNRLKMDNLTLGITTEINVHISPPFLLYKNTNTGAPPYGIWFYSQFDCNRISQLVKKLHSEVVNQEQQSPESTAPPTSAPAPIAVETPKAATPKVKPPPGLFPSASAVKTPDPKDESKVDILGMFRSATDKYIQNTPTTTTPTALQTPTGKVSLDALFKGATPILGQSTPNHQQQQQQVQSQINENGSNHDKTSQLKSLFGIIPSPNNANSQSDKLLLAQPIYSSSSNSDAEHNHAKFKPNTLPDTLAFELEKTKMSLGSLLMDSDSNSLDHSLANATKHQQPASFAILDDESHSENGLRSSPLARPNTKQLSRNLFGDVPPSITSAPTTSKLELLSPAAFGAPPPPPQVSAHSQQQASIDRERLKETLIALLETDHEFVNRVYTAYMKNVTKQQLS